MWGRGWGGVRGSVRTGLIVLAAAGLAASGAVTAEAGGAGQPAGTIYVQRTSVPVDTLAMAADGSALRSTGCTGDRTLAASPRRVLRLEPTGETFPAYGEGLTLGVREAVRLVSTDDSCHDRLVIADLPAGSAVSTASWSLDGARVAASILRYAPSGQLLDQGIWVGEVGGACGVPLCGFHLAVAFPKTAVAGQPGGGLTAYYEHALSSVRWSSDGRRVVIGRRADPAASGESAIFVADLGAPGSVVVRADQQVTVPGGAAYQPVFSPLAGDDRIAFVQATGRKSCFRNDIFVTTSAGGSARPVGSTPNGACQLGNPDWSPDATWLVYDAWSGSLADQQAIYRVRADGSTKPILVVADRGAVYRLPRWRH